MRNEAGLVQSLRAELVVIYMVKSNFMRSQDQLNTWRNR